MQPSPFSEFEHTPQAHFQLCFYGAVLNVISRMLLALGSFDALFERFPFLVGYNDELAEHGLNGRGLDDGLNWWNHSLAEWEEAAQNWLPLARLRQSGHIDRKAIETMFWIGLVEEDSRFGTLYEILQEQPGQRRPTFGLMKQWSGDDSVQTLIDFGLVRVGSPDVPRSERSLQIPLPVWEVIQGRVREQVETWLRARPRPALRALDELILADKVRETATMAPRLFRSGHASAIIVRGPERNGRRTLAGAIARELRLGVLELTPAGPDDERWKLTGALATLLDAMPVIVVDASPGERVEIPHLGGYRGPVAIVMGEQGGVTGAIPDRAVTLTLGVPDRDERTQLWRQCILNEQIESSENEIQAISERYRMTGGNIRRAARLAASSAALKGDQSIDLARVRGACHALNRQSLDTLAVEVRTAGDWGHLAVGSQTLTELWNLEARCRRREDLASAVGPVLSGQLNPGVRALFTGPSGTGKTLAARLLASSLEKDLYRVDLAMVVNKYIGETEKNLNQVFARAEQLDVILLIDEGDALLTGRTSVQSANDRYANFETNYLLQRIEAYEAVLIVTTNAAERIDAAFQRRMDVVVEFAPPGAAERHAIWRMHLPERHAIDPALLAEVAGRCTLTGGQIRNAALHASLLAVESDGIVTTSRIESAVQREYRKTGAVCPLRPGTPNTIQ